MKKLFLALILASGLTFLTGCITSTVQPTVRYRQNHPVSASGKRVIADIEATNYASFLFGFIPIVGGSHTLPNAWQYHMWTNTVTNRKTKYMMNWYAKRVMKADGIENVKITHETIGWPTLWIVTWRKIHATAQVVENTDGK